MQKEYIHSNIVKYTLSTGTEVTLSEQEIGELIDGSEIVTELKKEIVDLEEHITNLQYDLDSANDVKDDQVKLINRLEKEIDKLEQNKCWSIAQ